MRLCLSFYNHLFLIIAQLPQTFKIGRHNNSYSSFCTVHRDIDSKSSSVVLSKVLLLCVSPFFFLTFSSL